MKKTCNDNLFHITRRSKEWIIAMIDCENYRRVSQSYLLEKARETSTEPAAAAALFLFCSPSRHRRMVAFREILELYRLRLIGSLSGSFEWSHYCEFIIYSPSRGEASKRNQKRPKKNKKKIRCSFWGYRKSWNQTATGAWFSTISIPLVLTLVNFRITWCHLFNG